LQVWLLLFSCLPTWSWSTNRSSSSPCHLAADILMCEVLSKAAFCKSLSGPYIFPCLQ
jgi:hypothetical protein